MKDMDAAWLAGLLEGEGCFGTGSSGSPTIWLTMTDQDVVERVATLCMVGFSIRKPGKKDRKPAYSLHVCGEQALAVMRIILPFMGIRRAAKIREVMERAAARGGVCKGQRVGSAKLLDSQAAEILQKWKLNPAYGVQSALAREYGVTSQAIGALVRRKWWKHLEAS